MTQNPSTELSRTGEDFVVTREFLMEPGENIFLAANPFIAEDRFEAFCEYTGLDESETIFSLLSAIPMPARAATAPPVMKTSAGFNVEAMWVPMFWLPEASSRPQPVGETGRMESADEVAARLCLELISSGLYDPETGHFVDVLALHGIDIEDEADRDRAASWLLGAPDEVLDSIDLSAYLRLDSDPGWSVRESQNIYPDLLRSSWAVTSADLSEMLSELDSTEDDGQRPSISEIRDLAVMLFEKAGLALTDVELDPTAQPPAEFWAAMVARARAFEGDDVEGFLNDVVADAGQWLEAVSDHYSAALEGLDSKLRELGRRLGGEE